MKKQPTKPNSSNPVLTIIILSFNVADLLVNCLDAIYKFNFDKFLSGDWELLVSDNGSSDNTIEILRQKNYPGLKILQNGVNLGFAKGNNVAAKMVRGDYVLFLNPDTVVEKESIEFGLDYLRSHSNAGAVSVKLVLGSGRLDNTCHRGFPTPWNSFCFFVGLTKLFPTSRFFAGYILGHLNTNQQSEVDAINGAYFMMPKDLGKRLDWFDEDFFWKGEDLDLCYRIKEVGYKIMYLPQVKVWHYKGSSKGHKRGSKTLQARFMVMRLFYDKHYKNKYPTWLREFVFLGIRMRELVANFGI